jgi:hypothetical protein
MEWPYPFSPIDDQPKVGPVFEDELRRELKTGHVLFGLPVQAIGRRYDQDDVLFRLLDGSGRVAEVHLSYAGERERPPWPETALFDTFAQWIESVKEEFKNCRG